MMSTNYIALQHNYHTLAIFPFKSFRNRDELQSLYVLPQEVGCGCVFVVLRRVGGLR